MVYGYSDYKEYVPLTTENILKRVSQEEIFEIVVENVILEGELYYKAPYRHDNNADCYFSYHNDTLYFIDFADANSISPNKDCFGFIMACYKLTFIETLSFINTKLKLGLGDDSAQLKKEREDISLEKRNNIMQSLRRDKSITLQPRLFNYKDKLFWSKYGISRKNLEDDLVVPIKSYRAMSREGKYFNVKPSDIAYAYTEFQSGNMKIYRPEETQGFKWYTNCNQNDIGGLRDLSMNTSTIVITKSYKDCRVLKNMGINAIWFQSESMFPSVDILKPILNHFDKVIIWFDNDPTGLGKSKVLKDYIESFKPDSTTIIFLPPRLYLENIKDPSDYFAGKGNEKLLEFIETHKIELIKLNI